MILGKKQHLPRDPHRVEQGHRVLGPRRVPRVEGFDDLDLTVGSPRRQRGSQGQPLHLPRCPLRIVTGFRPVGDTATGPLRRTDRSVACSAQALLTPRLSPAATHLGAGLGRVSAGTGRRQLGGHHLVHHLHVRLDAEDVGIQLDISGSFAGCGVQLCAEIRHAASPPLESALRHP